MKRKPPRLGLAGDEWTGLFDTSEPSVTAAEVHASDEEGGDATGLVDQWGRPIYRVRKRVKFGFVP